LTERKRELTESELLHYMGDDACKWAEEFCKIARKLGHNIDEEWMITWFANAIEHSYSLRVRRWHDNKEHQSLFGDPK